MKRTKLGCLAICIAANLIPSLVRAEKNLPLPYNGSGGVAGCQQMAALMSHTNTSNPIFSCQTNGLALAFYYVYQTVDQQTYACGQDKTGLYIFLSSEVIYTQGITNYKSARYGCVSNAYRISDNQINYAFCGGSTPVVKQFQWFASGGSLVYADILNSSGGVTGINATKTGLSGWDGSSNDPCRGVPLTINSSPISEDYQQVQVIDPTQFPPHQ